MNLEFDRKLGPGFLTSVPDQSGIYIFRDETGQAIYVGKAKNLRRRLSQYRLASRKKAFRKMRTILRAAMTLEFRTCASEQEALLLENKLILEHRPRLNIAGAFSFLYPYLGFKYDPLKPRELALCYTTSPEILSAHGFELFGAYRSRLAARDAYDAFAYTLAFVGHHTPMERKRYGDIPYTRIICYRQLEAGWSELLTAFLRGESADCLSRIVQELLEKPDARQLAGEIQGHIKSLKLFFKEEAKKLRAALESHGIGASMIRQEDRDRIFLSVGMEMRDVSLKI